MLNFNFNNSPLTDKDMSLRTANLPWLNTISLLLLSLTTDSWSCQLFLSLELICFETLIPSKFDISILKFQKLYSLDPKSFDSGTTFGITITDCICLFHDFICSSHNPCFLFDSFLLFPPFISHLASIYKHAVPLVLNHTQTYQNYLTACVAT